MEFIKEFIHSRLFIERQQTANLVESLLQKIVHSKRLLADHIELLEQCQVIPINCTEISRGRKYIFQLMGGLALSSLAITSLKADINWYLLILHFECLNTILANSKLIQISLRILVPTVATTYGLYMSMETVVMIKNRLTQRRLNETIICIDKVDVAVGKNISFFRETKYLGDSSDRYDRCGNCLRSISEIIRIIYADVKHLEAITLPEYIESMYEPLEELSTCIYFQKNIEQFTSYDIKDFYNIFLYFQSQYFTRLCLVVCYARNCGMTYLNNENIQLRKISRINVEKLNVWLNHPADLNKVIAKNKSDANRLANINIDDIDTLDILKVKRSSMDILCRLIAITNQYQITDQRIQILKMYENKEEMLNILDEMQRVKESLGACQDDFETLKLMYSKCLAKKFQITVDEKNNQPEEDVKSIVDESKTNEPMESHTEEDNKEYFAIRDIRNNEGSDSDGENGKSKRAKWSDELENIDMNVTRSFFAPVLKQLKTKIDPIKEEMKEREMKFLMSKGIDREKIIEFNKNDKEQSSDSETESGSGSCSSSDNEPTRFKQRRQQNRYDEMRSFLEQKQPIRFMPLGNLPPLSGAEDVLE